MVVLLSFTQRMTDDRQKVDTRPGTIILYSDCDAEHFPPSLITVSLSLRDQFVQKYKTVAVEEHKKSRAAAARFPLLLQLEHVPVEVIAPQ